MNQTVHDVIEAASAGRAITYWGSITALHGERVYLHRVCDCRECLHYAPPTPRLRLYVPTVSHHLEHVRASSLRLAPFTSASAPSDDAAHND